VHHTVLAVLFTAALVVLTGLFAAAAAAVLARMDGATYPAALIRAAAVFGAVLTLAAVIAAGIAPYLA
jgi:hypothetical protein